MRLIRALVLALPILLASSCTATKQGIFFVDPHFDSAFGKTHRAQVRAAAQVVEAGITFSVLPLEGTLQAAFKIIDARKPDFICLSPLLALEAAKIDSQYPVLSVLVPGCLLDQIPPQIYASASDSLAAFKAVGRIMASYIKAYTAANPDLPFAAAVFDESLPGKDLYKESFVLGFAEIFAESPPFVKFVSPGADSSSLETVSQELFVMNTKIVLYAAGPADPILLSKTPKSGVLIVSEGIVEMPDAHPGLVLSIDDDGEALTRAVFDSWAREEPGLAKVPSLLVPVGQAADISTGERRLIDIIKDFSPRATGPVTPEGKKSP